MRASMERWRQKYDMPWKVKYRKVFNILEAQVLNADQSLALSIGIVSYFLWFGTNINLFNAWERIRYAQYQVRMKFTPRELKKWITKFWHARSFNLFLNQESWCYSSSIIIVYTFHLTLFCLLHMFEKGRSSLNRLSENII